MERTELFVCKCFDIRHQLVLRVLETKENEEHIVYGSFHLVHIPFWDKLKCAIKYLFGIKRKDGDFDAMLFCPEDADRLEWFAKYLDAGLSVTDRDTNPIHFTFQSRDNVYDVAFETRQSTLCDGSEPTDSELSVCVSMKMAICFTEFIVPPSICSVIALVMVILTLLNSCRRMLSDFIAWQVC